MRGLIIRFLITVSVFAAANVASFFARSDDLFTPDMPDAMTRFGFPLLVYQDGGPVALCFFSRAALCGDIAVAVSLSMAVAACYPSIRHEVLRALGHESKAST
jgi:hypothetical protein